MTRNGVCVYGGSRGVCAKRTALLYTPPNRPALRICNTLPVAGACADISLASQIPPGTPHIQSGLPPVVA